MKFSDGDKVRVNDPDSYIDEVVATLYSCDENGGHIEFDEKVWYVPFDVLTLEA